MDFRFAGTFNAHWECPFDHQVVWMHKRDCLACHGWPDHRPGCEMIGFPEPEADGRWDAQKVMDFVKARNMERAEAIAEAWGTYAVLRMPWDT